MAKRLFWIDDNAIHNGPDHEGYWLIDGGGWEATELQDIKDAWNEYKEAVFLRSHPLKVNTWNRMYDLLDALTKEER